MRVIKVLLILTFFLLAPNVFVNAQKKHEQIIEFTGSLEKGKSYHAEIEFNADFKEWQPVLRLNFPYHHAGRLEWRNLSKFSELKKGKPNERRQIIFKVMSKKVYQASLNRWNTIYNCKIIEYFKKLGGT